MERLWKEELGEELGETALALREQAQELPVALTPAQRLVRAPVPTPATRTDRARPGHRAGHRAARGLPDGHPARARWRGKDEAGRGGRVAAYGGGGVLRRPHQGRGRRAGAGADRPRARDPRRGRRRRGARRGAAQPQPAARPRQRRARARGGRDRAAARRAVHRPAGADDVTRPAADPRRAGVRRAPARTGPGRARLACGCDHAVRAGRARRGSGLRRRAAPRRRRHDLPGGRRAAARDRAGRRTRADPVRHPCCGRASASGSARCRARPGVRRNGSRRCRR